MSGTMKKKTAFDSKIQSWLEGWLDYAMPALISGVENHSHLHIDDLLGKTSDNQEIVEVSLQAFHMLIKQVAEWKSPIKLSLVIPLQPLDNKITLSVPHDVQDVISQLDFVPPSLNIIRWQSFYSPTLLHPIVLEEYRSPLRFDLFKNSDDKTVAYYHEIRNQEEFDASEEFRRRILVDCFLFQ